MSDIPEQLLRDEARNKWVNNLRIGDKVQYRLRNENEPRLEELKIGVIAAAIHKGTHND